jgi:hypothetical protein
MAIRTDRRGEWLFFGTNRCYTKYAKPWRIGTN